ncbi:transposase [Chamaesiphon polymorphus]
MCPKVVKLSTQGAVEEINQKIKSIERRVYGLTNFRKKSY